MVIHFPAAKLGLLAIRQLSRYVGNFIKDRARENYIFRTYICMPPAQAYNYLEVQTKSLSLRLGKPVRVPPLTEAAAIELGSSILGEFIVFAITVGVVFVEYSRSKMSENRKKEKLRQEKLKMLSDISKMQEMLKSQESYIEDISKALDKLGQPVYHKTQKKPADGQVLKSNVEEKPTQVAFSWIARSKEYFKSRTVER